MNKKRMYKILIYCSFAVASSVVIVAFITSTTYTQLAIATILYPLPVCLVFKAFPRKNGKYTSKEPVTAIQPPVKSAQTAAAEATEAAEVKKEKIAIAIEDIDKRAFLKLIGGIGLSAVIFQLISKKIGGPSSGNTVVIPETISLKDIAGNKIDPVEKSPTDGYKITEIDDSEVSYYGFINIYNAWYIMRGDAETGSFRYSRGDSDFPGNWANRKKIKYHYYHDIFRT